MDTSVTFIAHDDPPAADLAVVYTQLRQFNQQHTGDLPQKPVHLFLYAADGQVVGGLFGSIGWGWLHIDILWVAEAYRQQGWGARLVGEAEAMAQTMGVVHAYLETTDFQAYDFYQRLGYVEFAVLEDQPPGHRCYYLKKALPAAGGGDASTNDDAVPPA